MNGINALIKETPGKKKRERERLQGSGGPLAGTGGPLAGTLLPMQGSQVRFLVGELGPA